MLMCHSATSDWRGESAGANHQSRQTTMSRKAVREAAAPKLPEADVKAAPVVAPASADAVLVVGVGASAGGLDALTEFLRPIPKSTACAFVVVQHLDPTNVDILPELLQRVTELPVQQVTETVTIVAGRVYVIAPNSELTVADDHIIATVPTEPHGFRLPVDLLFQSLAVAYGERSIGVVLSGMGTDGTRGATAIRTAGGAVLVQDPLEAKYGAMPLGVLESGAASTVGTADDLYARIEEYRKNFVGTLSSATRVAKFNAGADALANVSTAGDGTPEERQQLRAVIAVLKGQTSHDFSQYKTGTILRRVERRIAVHQLAGIDEYATFLRQNRPEGDLLLHELLIGVTGFFRDQETWEQLKAEEIPALITARPEGGVIRAWVAGCSTGEEAYSLAIIFLEVIARLRPNAHFTIQIFATDLDKHAIEFARAGLYPAAIADVVSADRLERYFVKDSGKYRIGRTVRDMLVFAPQNMIMDPPFSKLDLLTCRNLLIYLTPALQRRLMPFFHYALNPGGLLVLGNSETAGSATKLFAALPGKARIYRRSDPPVELSPHAFKSPRLRVPLGTAAIVTAPPVVKERSLVELVDRALLQHYEPSAVLVTEQGDILNVTGRTGQYLEPAAGQSNWNLFAMLREGIDSAVSEAFNRAVRTKSSVTTVARVGDDEAPSVQVVIAPLADEEQGTPLVLVIFSTLTVSVAPVESGADASERARERSNLVRELRRNRVELHNSHVQTLASQQELTSAIRDLQSSNEELQSTNDELTTSKEEAQSVNEELQTVNHELRAKLSELADAGSDVANLLNSTSIATLFLDSTLRVRRFTTQTAKITRLIPADIGRPITDIASTLNFAAIAGDASEVMRTLATSEKEVFSSDSHWFVVRIMPYRTLDDRIDGIVITFTDVTKAKVLEAALREAQGMLEGRIATQIVELSHSRSETAAANERSADARGGIS